jgi:hypothetical protein
MDWDTIRESIQVAVLATFDELIVSVGDERLYVICLQTADDGISIGAGANTEEGYSAKCASEAELEDMTPEYRSYLRWAPAEWRFEVIGDAHFSGVNRDLSILLTDPDSNSTAHFARLIQIMTDGLAYLREARAEMLNNVALFVTISDSEIAEDVEQQSAGQLNPPSILNELLTRYA